jgi:hypothetical protein
MFCSELCRDKANDRYHYLMCASIDWFSFAELAISDSYYKFIRFFYEALAICGRNFEKLEALLDDPQKITGFDLDYSNRVTDLEQLKVICSLHQYKSKEDAEQWLANYVVQQFSLNPYEVKVFSKGMKLFCLVSATNSSSISFCTYDQHDKLTTNILGIGLFTINSFFNHSCAPNVNCINVDNKLVFVVSRNVQSGEMLSITYGFVK